MKKPTDKTTNTMYRAVAKYIEEAGGTAVVIGGVSIAQKTDGRKKAFTVMIDVTGNNPIETS